MRFLIDAQLPPLSRTRSLISDMWRATLCFCPMEMQRQIEKLPNSRILMTGS